MKSSKSIEKLKAYMNEEDTKLICKTIKENETGYDKHVKISISSALMTYNIPKLLDENEIIYVVDSKKNKYIIPAKYEKYIHDCGLYKGYIGDNIPIIFGVKFIKDNEVAVVYHMIEENHDETLLVNNHALHTLYLMKQDEIISVIKSHSEKNTKKKKEEKQNMTLDNNLWVPDMNPDQNPDFLYPLSAYKTLRNRIKEEFYKDLYLLCDLEDENNFKINDEEENDIRYVKVKTTDENQSVIVPINKDNVRVLDHIKTENQTYKKLELKIYNKEINYKGFVTVIYSENEIYMSVSGIHMISMLQPNDIKNLIFEASTDQAVKNKTRKRINKKKH